MEDVKKYLEKNYNRISDLLNIFERKNIGILFDKLNGNKKDSSEVLYFKLDDEKEKELMFIFGYDFFMNELEEQEFKQKLSNDLTTYNIYKAYNNLRKNMNEDEIKITDILKELQDENKAKDSLSKHKLIEKIFSQAYYLDWDLKKVENSLETDYFIKIPKNFLIKIKKRYNLNIIETVYEDENLFIFINGKNKFICVLKNDDEFSKNKLISYLEKPLKIIFDVKNINFLS